MRIVRPLVVLARAGHRLRDLRKFYVFALLAVLASAGAVRSRRPPRLRFAERWGWRLALTSYCVMPLSLFVTYWIANLDLVFFAVTLPSLLLTTKGERTLVSD